jgi:hypothetical protein
MKKIAIVALIATLTSCGGGTTEAPATTDSTTVSVDTTAVDSTNVPADTTVVEASATK